MSFSPSFSGNFVFFCFHPEVPVAFCRPGQGRSQPLVTCSGWSFLTSKFAGVSGGGRGSHFFFRKMILFSTSKCIHDVNINIYTYIYLPKGSNISHPMNVGERVPLHFFFGEGVVDEHVHPPGNEHIPLSKCCFFFPRSILHFHAHCSKGKQDNPPRRIFFDGKKHISNHLGMVEQWTTFHSAKNIFFVLQHPKVQQVNPPEKCQVSLGFLPETGPKNRFFFGDATNSKVQGLTIQEAVVVGSMAVGDVFSTAVPRSLRQSKTPPKHLSDAPKCHHFSKHDGWNEAKI